MPRTATIADALASFEESLAISRDLSRRSPRDEKLRGEVAYSLLKVGDVQNRLGQFDASFVSLSEGLETARALTSNAPTGTWNDVRRLASTLGSLAYRSLLARQYDLSLRSSDAAISGAPDLIWLYGNRAHALMLLDRSDEAREIYLRYRKQSTQGEPWEKAVVNDFTELRKAGISDPLMAEIEALFGA